MNGQETEKCGQSKQTDRLGGWQQIGEQKI